MVQPAQNSRHTYMYCHVGLYLPMVSPVTRAWAMLVMQHAKLQAAWKYAVENFFSRNSSSHFQPFTPARYTCCGQWWAKYFWSIFKIQNKIGLLLWKYFFKILSTTTFVPFSLILNVLRRDAMRKRTNSRRPMSICLSVCLSVPLTCCIQTAKYISEHFSRPSNVQQ